MALGIVTDDDFLAELNKLVPAPKPNESVKQPELGRNGTKEVPQEIRKMIAEESLSGTSANEIHNVLGISQSSISAYKKGATSTSSYNNPNNDLKDHVAGVRGKITKRASSKLLKALHFMDDGKLADADARDLSAIAAQMSTVVKNMNPADQVVNTQANVQFVIYAPPMKALDSYPVIEVGE